MFWLLVSHGRERWLIRFSISKLQMPCFNYLHKRLQSCSSMSTCFALFFTLSTCSFIYISCSLALWDNSYGRHRLFTAHFFRISIRSLNAQIESRENWTPAQNGTLNGVGGGDRAFSLATLPHPLVLGARALRLLFLSCALKNREAVNYGRHYIIPRISEHNIHTEGGVGGLLTERT